MKQARVYIGCHHGLPPHYFYGCVIDGVFVDDAGGPCPGIPLAVVELQNENGDWNRELGTLRTTNFLKLRRRPGRRLQSSICGG